MAASSSEGCKLTESPETKDLGVAGHLPGVIKCTQSPKPSAFFLLPWASLQGVQHRSPSIGCIPVLTTLALKTSTGPAEWHAG